ncbi:MAG: hypothetical protein IPP70_03555 [Elusimicrobia bacterium]|nr:hypothetical protein [Elusimicrobiota bacterium]
MLSNTFEGFPMRRVSSLDFPLGSAFHKVLAGFLSLALVLGPASAFSYDDDRYTYTPPRVQNYQNQYRPQNNFSPSSQLNRQISNMNSVLTFKQNVGFTNPKIDLKTDQLSQDTFKPKILFQLAMANPVKAPVLGTKPLQPISIAKPGFFGAVQSIFKGIGAGFHKVGQAIGNVVQRVFTRADKPGVVSPQQREILAQFPNLQPTGPNSFVAVGKATVAWKSLGAGLHLHRQGREPPAKPRRFPGIQLWGDQRQERGPAPRPDGEHRGGHHARGFGF